MNLLSRDELRNLAEHDGGPCVSIYMPTHRKGKESLREDPIRLKNQLAEVEEQLLTAGLRQPDVKKLLQSAHNLLGERPFWEHQSDGLALFISPDLFVTYSLPLPFEELAITTDHHFHLKPLLPLFAGDGRFYLLALTQNSIRLLQGTRYSIDAVDVGDMPQSLAEALADEDPEKQLQMHSSTTPSVGGTGSTLPGGASTAPGHGGKGGTLRQAMFHGHGDELQNKDVILRYFRQIDTGVRELLKDEGTPLLLAGVDYLFPIYQEANKYPHLVEKGVPGSPEELRAEELHEAAWALIEPYFRQEQQEAAATYHELLHNGRAANDIKTIIPAAYYGAVDALFVNLDHQQWGTFDPDSNTIQLHDEPNRESEDLIDTAAVHTFLNNGSVYALPAEEMPDNAHMAATFRYEPTAVAAVNGQQNEGE